MIVSRYETFPHQLGKLVPCLNRPFTCSPPVGQNLIIPINSIAREFSSSKSYFPKFRKVLTIKHMLNFPFPLKKSIRIIFTIKRWNFQFQSVQTIISTTSSSKWIDITWISGSRTSSWTVCGSGLILLDVLLLDLIVGPGVPLRMVSSRSGSRMSLAGLNLIKPLMDLI